MIKVKFDNVKNSNNATGGIVKKEYSFDGIDNSNRLYFFKIVDHKDLPITINFDFDNKILETIEDGVENG